MKFALLTQEAQDLENLYRLYMEQFHAVPARLKLLLTCAATTKVRHTVRPTLPSPSPPQVYFIYTTQETGNVHFLAEKDQRADPNNSTDTEDLPPRSLQPLMLMCNRNHPRIVKPPKILSETGSSTRVGW